MILSDIQMLLMQQEGCKLFPYKCTAGKMTIGIGRNLEDTGISEKEALYMLNEDIKKCHKDLLIYFFPHQFDVFPEPVQNAILSMRFQLGHGGFKSFKKMIFAFKDEDYPEAIRQMKDSKWYEQTQGRADELILMIEKATQEKAHESNS